MMSGTLRQRRHHRLPFNQLPLDYPLFSGRIPCLFAINVHENRRKYDIFHEYCSFFEFILVCRMFNQMDTAMH